MIRVLLLISRTSYRAEAFLCAAQRLGMDVIVGTDHRSTLSGLVPDVTLTLDLTDPEAAARAIVARGCRERIDAVLSVDDAGVQTAARAAEALGLAHHSPASVRAARLKIVMREVFRDAGVPSPPFALLQPEEPAAVAKGRVPLPCVVKPVALSASRGVMRVDNQAELTAAVERLRGILRNLPAGDGDAEVAGIVLLEGYIPGVEVAVEGLLTEGELRILAVFDKPDPLEGPTFEETLLITPSRLPPETLSRVRDTTARAAEALGLRHGPIHAELRINDQGVWPLEIAPRSIGGLCSRTLRFRGGRTLEEVLLLHATGTHNGAFEREEEASGVMMIPIPAGGILREVLGTEEALAVPGIENLVIAIPLGGRVIPLPEGNRYLGFLFARGGSATDVERALRAAHGRLSFSIEDD